MSKHEREDFLAALHVGVLAVERPDGPPLVTPVWYRYTPGGAVELNTQRSSKKTHLLERAGHASLCAQREDLRTPTSHSGGPVEIEATDRATARRHRQPYLGTGDGHRYCGRRRSRRRHRRPIATSALAHSDFSKLDLPGGYACGPGSRARRRS